MRSVGQVDLADLPKYESVQYTVLIDLSSVKDRMVTIGTATRAVTDWATVEANGAALCYANYTSTLTGPYPIIINAGAQNGTGIGVAHNFANTPPVNVASSPQLLLTRAAASVQMEAPFKNIPDAFQPNHQHSNLAKRYGVPYNQIGDTDEPYDAPDYNNFFMALRRSAAASSDDITPSFHRPELINYIASLDTTTKLNLYDLQQAASSNYGEIFLSFLQAVQRATGRPLSYSIANHPNVGTIQSHSHFTGGTSFTTVGGALVNPQLQFDWASVNNNPSNPAQEAFDAWLRWQLRGPWDVDNDADGIKDSIWVDANFPLSTSPEGKLLKTLVAFYIEDMDGKLDINAAGSQVQATGNFALQLSDTRFAYLNPPVSPTPKDWSQGLGAGPADINMLHLFDNATDMQNTFVRRYSSDVAGDDKPGRSLVDDPLSRLIAHHSGTNNSMQLSTHNNLRLPGLPRGNHGRLGIALDLLGNPVLMDGVLASNVLSDTQDDPYDSNVLRPGHYDRHIAIGEWERIIRYNDPDRSTLPRGLEKVSGASFALANTNFTDRIHSITPRSASLTLPRITRNYQDQYGQQRRVASFIEFVEEYFQRRFSEAYPAIENAELRQLFPVEFQQNRPLDLNRPFGNGLDDDNDGDVDESDELLINASGALIGQVEQYTGSPVTNGNYTRGRSDFDPGWDPSSTFKTSTLNNTTFGPWSGNRSRQLMARHLYCLAQLILPVDPNTQNNEYIFPNQPNRTVAVDNETRARILAQWAVNVVDFRDADAAMTRFSYDPNPFNKRNMSGQLIPSWQPDGTHVVFGFEQPELLITESLATHDVRVYKKPAPANNYEQMRLPEGSLFLEFFNPRTTASNAASDNLLPGLPRALYGTNGSGQMALDLSRTVTDGTNTYPVWRVLITEPRVDSSGVLQPDEFTTIADGDDTEPTIAASSQFAAVTKGVDGFNYSYQIGNADAGLKWRHVTTATDISGGTPLTEPKIDRVLWFANVAPTASNTCLPTTVTNPESRVYYYRAGNTMLQGGQYLVVGPRPITYFGSKDSVSMPRDHTPNNHRLVLRWDDPNGGGGSKWEWAQLYNADKVAGLWISNTNPHPSMPAPPAFAPFAGEVRPCITMVAGANMPNATDWPADTEITQTYIGLNISEPNPAPGEYYPQPTFIINKNNNTADPDNNAPGYKNLSKDGYLDMSGPTASGSQAPFDTSDTGSSAFFLGKHKWPAAMDSMGSPAHAKPQTQKNWSAAVLQRLADPSRPWHIVLNPYITVDWQSIDLTVFSGEAQPAEEGSYYFATRSKSGRHNKVVGTTRQVGPIAETFYSYETNFPSSPTTNPTSVSTGRFFKQELVSEFYAGGSTTAPEQQRQTTTGNFASLGYLNRSYIIRNTASTQYNFPYYQGVPAQTVHAPYHPNRNFVNALELTNVPISGPAEFQQDFCFENVGQTPQVPRHRHTLDFETTTLISAPKSKTPYGLAEMWDLVNVGSLWPDAWTVHDPAKVAAVGGTTNAVLAQNELLGAHEAPLNVVPTYREPGRVNLNTAIEPLVLKGLMGNLMKSTDRGAASSATIPFTQPNQRVLYTPGTGSSVLDARAPNSGNPKLDANFPSQVPLPYTASSASYMSPLAGLQRANPTDTSLLRRMNGQVRVFDQSDTNLPFFDPYSSQAYPHNLIKNSFIYNYPAARLANMTTDRSNVYTIRITLGFFEYDPSLGIGKEYGSEEGRATRHRAFYLIDRSIPVGFQTGEDLNTSDVILSRRILD